MISVIVPALNEEKSIVATIEELRRSLAAGGLAGSEILVVDDGSVDATASLAESCDVRVIRHQHNLGYGRAIKTGILAAAHDTIVITDADGTYPVEQIPALVKEYEKGFDMVVGQRTAFRESFAKAPLRLVLKWLVEFTTGRRVPDVNSGLRVFGKATSLRYLKHLSDTFSFTTSLTLAYMMTNRFVTYLPISYRARVGRTKVRMFRDALRTLQYITQAIIYYNPLKIFLLVSLFCVGVSVVCFALAATAKLVSVFLLAIGAVLLAILVFCMGLLAELLRQIMDK